MCHYATKSRMKLRRRLLRIVTMSGRGLCECLAGGDNGNEIETEVFVLKY